MVIGGNKGTARGNRRGNRVLDAVAEGRAALHAGDAQWEQDQTQLDAEDWRAAKTQAGGASALRGKRATRAVQGGVPASAPHASSDGIELYDEYGNPVRSEDLLLGRYLPEGEIGSGGFSSVVLAFDTRIQRKVAIKCMALDDSAALPGGSILLDGVSFDATALPGLEEARTAAKLSDATIVQVYDFEVQGSMAYLILEYVEGMTLSRLLDIAADEMNPDVVAAVFKAVSHAIEVAHKHHVLHLDIKPDNVLIDAQGQVKVTDFGLARLAGEAGWGAAEGGTIGYMPPEQLEQRDLDERCDEWALASLTYEMISGGNPFMVGSLDEAADAIYDAEIVIPTLCMEGIDEAADDAIFCALDPNRDGRYGTVAEFAADLLPCLGSTRKGKNALRRIVGAEVEEAEDAESDDADPAYREPLFSGLSERARSVLMRGWAAIGAGLMGYMAMRTFCTALSAPDAYAWGGLAVCALLAALLPGVGALVSCIALGTALCAVGAWPVGVLLVVAACPWWWFCARESVEAANVGMGGVLFGAVGLASLVPFAGGYLLYARDALFSTLFAAFLAFIMAGLGSDTLLWWNVVMYGGAVFDATSLDTFVRLVMAPSTWLLIVAWALAALASSVLCSTGRRWLCVLGMVVAALLLVVAFVGGVFLENGDLSAGPFSVASIIFTSAIGITMGTFVPSRVYE